jgi:predicted nucleic acid-binding protein
MSRPQTFFAGNAPMPDILDRARTIESQCRVAEDGPDVAQQLHTLLAVGDTRGKQIHDANIVATMLAHRIRTLLTGNVADFTRWGHLIGVRPL